MKDAKLSHFLSYFIARPSHNIMRLENHDGQIIPIVIMKFYSLFSLEKLRGNGILHKLQNQWVRAMKMEDINPPATIEVTLYHVKGILLVYAGTVLFSFVVLLLECVISKCNTPQFQYMDWLVYKFNFRLLKLRSTARICYYRKLQSDLFDINWLYFTLNIYND